MDSIKLYLPTFWDVVLVLTFSFYLLLERYSLSFEDEGRDFVGSVIHFASRSY